MGLNTFTRLRYSPFLAQLVVIRRCNLSCGYCSEYDKSSEPIPFDVLEPRLLKLAELGTLAICLTGGEPTLHPELPRLVRKCRDLGFFRTGMISNGFLLRPEVIDQLNDAGLQEMQLSIDGVYPTQTTQTVLINLEKRLQWLSERARFNVTVNAVLGSCPPGETLEVVNRVRSLGFRVRVQFVHDHHGRLKLGQDLQAYDQIVRKLPGFRWILPVIASRSSSTGLLPSSAGQAAATFTSTNMAGWGGARKRENGRSGPCWTIAFRICRTSSTPTSLAMLPVLLAACVPRVRRTGGGPSNGQPLACPGPLPPAGAPRRTAEWGNIACLTKRQSGRIIGALSCSPTQKERIVADFNLEHKAVLDDLLLGHPGVRAGKMFGFPAYYAGKKLAICLYEQGVGVKLPASSAARLLESDPNVVPFQPLGRPRMREWVRINLSRSEDYGRYEPVFHESIRFLLDQQTNSPEA